MNTYFILFDIGAFIISAAINKLLIFYLNKKGVLDIPNDRSSHVAPTPRGGGIGVVVGTVLCSIIYAAITGDSKLFLLIFISSLMAVAGWADDVKKGLRASIRFSIQFICSLAIILIFNPIDILPLPAPLDVHLHFVGIIISILWLMGITNIFNFLDGIDGYAGIQGFIAGLMLSLLTWPSSISYIALFVSFSCAGFLLFNWQPGKIFMGDVGSSFLGFLFAAMPFYLKDIPGNAFRTNAFFATAILLWFFLLDGTFTILRRIVKKEKLWQAHRSHLYQRLVISGMSHSEVVITVCFFYSILYAITLFYAIQPSKNIVQWPVIIMGFILFFIYLSYTLIRENQSAKGKKRIQMKKIIHNSANLFEYYSSY